MVHFMQYDKTDIKNKNDLVEVISRYVDLKKDSHEYKGCCPFHDEKTASFSVVPAKDFYFCFGCGASGDVIQFMQDIHNCDFKEACEILGGEKTSDVKPVKRELKEVVDIYAGFKPVIPPPEEILSDTAFILNPKKVPDYGFVTRRWKIDAAYPYTLSNGQLSHYVIRTIINDNKITPTVYWCEWPDGGAGWTIFKTEESRPLYNLHQIKNNPNADVYIVEGEKAAKMGIEETHYLTEQMVFTCWPGGTNGARKTDFLPLAGRNILLVPDNDLPGYKCLRGWHKDNEKIPGVIDYLKAVEVNSIAYVLADVKSPKGWDIADKDGVKGEKWKQGELVGFLKDRRRTKLQTHPDEKKEKSEKKAGKKDSNSDNEKEPESKEIVIAQPPPETDDFEILDLSDMPFRVLGYHHAYRYYMPHSTQQIVELTAAAHAKNQLMVLAPLEYWLQKFGNGQKTSSINWDYVINTLFKLSTAKGLFNIKDSIRGRGAWLDNGRSILHLGETIYVDGKKFKPEDVDSKFVYEKNHDIGFEPQAPANNKEAAQLVELFQRCEWENEVSAYLIAGWCMIAPVCGILDWRPHVWITGASGCGKSTVVDRLIEPMLGSTMIRTEGKTTEAGIRQTLGQDARPVVYDEAEGEDKKNASRIQEILDLARVSSSGGVITKGSQDGEGVSYRVRAIFCFSAINTSIKHLADENRITQLVLNHNLNVNAGEEFKVFSDDIQRIINPEYSAKMFSRSLENLDTLVYNIKVFIDVCTPIFKSKRTADQIGTLMAGCYLCYMTDKITPENARKWITDNEFSEVTTAISGNDLERLISKISTYRLNVNHEYQKINITIGEAIISAAGLADPDSILDKMSKDCLDEIKRIGIKLDDDEDFIIISTSCDPLRKVLDGSQWSTSWGRVLMEHKEATKITKTVYFSNGQRSRAVRMPIKVFTNDV